MEKDNLVFSLIEEERQRQMKGIELIASENFVSDQVMEAMGSVLTNKYAEGYPGKRHYGGCQVVDKVETLAIERICKLFGAEYANVQPHSGAQANAAVLLACLQPGDTFMGLDLNHGGHLSHGSLVNTSGLIYKPVAYYLNKETGRVDYDEMERLAIENKPKLIIGGASAYSREWDYKRMREIADKVGALLMIDMAHPAGLIAAGLLDNPVKYAHIVTSTTHKTLRGPRGGIILMGKDFENPWGKTTKKGVVRMMSSLLNSAVFPGQQGGPLEHVIAALSMNIAPVSANVTVNVSNANETYSGWNLENVSLSSASAIAGTVDLSSASPKISGNESNEIVYEFASPSALRTKAQRAIFQIFPSIGNGSNITLCYHLEKNGKRVAISHLLKFPQQSSAGAAISINETIPDTIEGNWSAEGSGVVYTNVFPGKTWEETSPESRGFSSSKLEQLKSYLRTITTTSMMVAVGGKVIFSYGDIAENVKIASCRKSLLSTLYGNYVKDGTIDLDKTLAELGIDEDENSWGGASHWDGGKLLESEKQATIKDLLTARSGIFHKPANSGDDHDYMSAADRGKYPHGTYFLYNNWDFNCAGGVFEQLTGKDIYAAFKTDIADPCEWQDYDLSRQAKTEEYKGASRFLAYHFIISTRDMLRMALLMLNKGNWDGRQIVPQDWAELITSTYTKRADMHPSYRLTREFEYGWLWWTFCPEYTGYDASIFEGGFTATGSGGQYITALPALNMVIAHKDKSRTMEKSTYYGIIKRLAACKE